MKTLSLYPKEGNKEHELAFAFLKPHKRRQTDFLLRLTCDLLKQYGITEISQLTPERSKAIIMSYTACMRYEKAIKQKKEELAELERNLEASRNIIIKPRPISEVSNLIVPNPSPSEKNIVSSKEEERSEQKDNTSEVMPVIDLGSTASDADTSTNNASYLDALSDFFGQ